MLSGCELLKLGHMRAASNRLACSLIREAFAKFYFFLASIPDDIDNMPVKLLGNAILTSVET
jgi:hypothetical protein